MKEDQPATTALELVTKDDRRLQAAGLDRFPALIARAGSAIEATVTDGIAA